jgi:hypothetical protein
MAMAKCRQIVEGIAKQIYSHSIGAPNRKPLVTLVQELRESLVIPADIFTHYHNVRKHGNLALHGGHDETAALRLDFVRSVLGAAARITSWYLLEYQRPGELDEGGIVET